MNLDGLSFNYSHSTLRHSLVDLTDELDDGELPDDEGFAMNPEDQGVSY